MTIEFHCPHCQKFLRTNDEKAGAAANCPGCGQNITVPEQHAGQDDHSAGTDAAPGPTQPPGYDPGATTQPQTPGYDYTSGGGYPSGSGGGYQSSAGYTQHSGGQDASGYGAPPGGPQYGAAGGTKNCPMCGAVVDAQSPSCPQCGEVLPVAGGPGTSHPAGSVPIDAGDVIGRSWRIYMGQFGLVFGGVFLAMVIMGAAGIPANIVDTIMQNQQLDEGELAIALVFYFIFELLSWLVQVFMTLGTYIFLMKIARGERAEISDLFKGGPYYLRGLLLNFIVSLMVGIGLLACIVPGVILALMFWPYGYLLVDRNLPGVDALSRAKDITANNWGSVFVLGLASIGINLLGMLAFCIGLIFTIPLTSLMFAVAYLMMTGQRLAPESEPPYAGHYPPHAGYPPQQTGYPTQQSGYPPQPPGYPPGGSGYPPQG